MLIKVSFTTNHVDPRRYYLVCWAEHMLLLTLTWFTDDKLLAIIEMKTIRNGSHV